MLHRLLCLGLAAVAIFVAACADSADAPTHSPTPSTSATVSGTPLATNGGIVPTTPTPTPTNQVTYATAATENERVVALLESGNTRTTNAISGGVVLHNRNRTEAVVIPYTVELVLRSGGTALIATQNLVLLPDQTVGDAFNARYTVDDSDIASVKISVQAPSARWLIHAAPERLAATTTTEADGVSGRIASPFDDETGPLRLSLLGRNGEGKIVTGKPDELDSIPAHGNTGFDASISNAPDVVSWEVYVSFAGDFPDWMRP